MGHPGTRPQRSTVLPAQDAFGTDCLATNDRPSAVLAQWTNPHAEWARQLRSTIGPVELITDLQPEGLHETCFDEIHSLPTVASTHDALPAEDIVETQFGQLIAAALERVAINRPWGAIWLHSRFLTRCWDAPRDLSLLEEDRNEGPDQEQDGQDESMENKTESIALEMDGEMLMPPLSLFESTQPPQIELSEQGHPDLVTAWMNTYGCSSAAGRFAARYPAANHRGREPGGDVGRYQRLPLGPGRTRRASQRATP